MFDQRSAIIASIAVAMVGWAVFMGLSILVGALVDFRGFTEEQVGYIASADLGGMYVSSIIVSLYIKKIGSSLLGHDGHRHRNNCGRLRNLRIRILVDDGNPHCRGNWCGILL
jgi:hypothetical protein